MARTSDRLKQSRLIRAEMLLRGMSRRDIAYESGLSVSTISHLICGDENSPGQRARFEDTLGSAIWDSLEHFTKRQQMKATLGVDPYTVPLAKLQDAISAAGLPFGKINTPKHKLLAALEEHFDQAPAATAPSPAVANTDTHPEEI